MLHQQHKIAVLLFYCSLFYSFNLYVNVVIHLAIAQKPAVISVSYSHSNHYTAEVPPAAVDLSQFP